MAVKASVQKNSQVRDITHWVLSHEEPMRVLFERPFVPLPRQASFPLPSFELKGVLSAGNPRAGAVILLIAGKTKVYHVGDKLPEGIQIRAIHSDHVVLRKGQQEAKLYLPYNSLF